jgi:hypothetical protein
MIISSMACEDDEIVNLLVKDNSSNESIIDEFE